MSLIGFIEVEWLKNFLLLYTQMMIYSILFKMVVMSNFLLIKFGIFRVDVNSVNVDDTNHDEGYTDIIHSYFWLSIVILENVKHLKKG